MTIQPGHSREVKFVKQNISMDDVDRVQSSTGYSTSEDSKFCKVKASIDAA